MKISKLSIALTTSTLMMSMQAHAFLTDTSNQKVVYIGKGGAENMQQVQVNEIKSAVPEVRVSETRTVVPSQAQTYTQPTYNNANTYNTYTPPATTYNTPTYNTTYNTPTSNYSSGSNYSGSYNASNYSGQLDRLAVSTNSAAVMVFDVQTGQPIYEKNVNTTRSIASITKMMTAMVVLDANQNMRDEITVSGSDLVGAKQASTRLKAGDRMTRAEFMLLMLMKSENPAAKALASNYPGGYDAFISAMNQKAQSLGMYSTHFSDSSGLNPRNVSSASDLLKMMREINTNPRYQTIRNFSTTTSHDFYITNYNSGSRTFNASNTSTLVRSGNYALGASKTGYIREAGHCVVMEAHVNGRPSIIVLLGANGSQNRWRDAETILGQLAYR